MSKLYLKIFDENNHDVTPKSLFEPEVSKTRHGSALFQSIEGNSTVFNKNVFYFITLI